MIELKEKIIVSLTSYPKRIASVAPCIMSLLAQTVRADEVVLWLGEDDFPRKEDELPKRLLMLKERGLSIRWCKHTLYSHDKYFWIMQEQPDAVVITVDDDVYYRKDLIALLLAQHKRYPSCVVSMRSHRVQSENGEIKPYSEWVMEQRDFHNTPKMGVFSTGIGGVLYPAHCFSEALFDEKRIRELCPRTDDLWLFLHEVKEDIPTVPTRTIFKHDYVPDTQEDGLFQENVKQGGNDEVLKVLFEAYPDVKQKLLRIIDHTEAELEECTKKEATAEAASSNSI